MVNAQFRPGLEGVVAAQTRFSSVDGLRRELVEDGYALEDLAPITTFEEVAYLWFHHEPPTGAHLPASAHGALRRALFRPRPNRCCGALPLRTWRP